LRVINFRNVRLPELCIGKHALRWCRHPAVRPHTASTLSAPWHCTAVRCLRHVAALLCGAAFRCRSTAAPWHRSAAALSLHRTPSAYRSHGLRGTVLSLMSPFCESALRTLAVIWTILIVLLCVGLCFIQKQLRIVVALAGEACWLSCAPPGCPRQHGGVRKPPRCNFCMSFRISRGSLTRPWEHIGLGCASPAQVSRKFGASLHRCGTTDLHVFGKHGERRVRASLAQVLNTSYKFRKGAGTRVYETGMCCSVWISIPFPPSRVRVPPRPGCGCPPQRRISADRRRCST
jgi:hypothetical protein